MRPPTALRLLVDAHEAQLCTVAANQEKLWAALKALLGLGGGASVAPDGGAQPWDDGQLGGAALSYGLRVGHIALLHGSSGVQVVPLREVAQICSRSKQSSRRRPTFGRNRADIPDWSTSGQLWPMQGAFWPNSVEVVPESKSDQLWFDFDRNWMVWVGFRHVEPVEFRPHLAQIGTILALLRLRGLRPTSARNRSNAASFLGFRWRVAAGGDCTSTRIPWRKFGWDISRRPG